MKTTILQSAKRLMGIVLLMLCVGCERAEDKIWGYVELHNNQINPEFHVLSIKLAENSGKPLEGVPVTAHIKQEAEPNRDGLVIMREVAPGYYANAFQINDAGVYNAVVYASIGEINHEFSSRLELNPDGTGKLLARIGNNDEDKVAQIIEERSEFEYTPSDSWTFFNNSHALYQNGLRRTVTFAAQDGNERIIRADSATLDISSKDGDEPFNYTEDLSGLDDGEYTAFVDFPAHGIYIAKITLVVGNESSTQTINIDVKPQAN